MLRLMVKTFAVALGLLLAASSTRAEVSLAMEDRIDEISVTLGGRLHKFTVIRDAWNRFQWYVVPDQPRLAERVVDGKPVPVLSLFLIQTEDLKKSGGLVEEALLQFAVSLAIPAEAQETLRGVIAKHESVTPEKITLASLPLSSAEAHLYVPASGEFLASASLGTGIAPVFSTQQQTFTLHLTKKGANTLATAIQSGTGVNISYVLNYEGLTPKAGFKVKVNWSQLATHYSRNDRAKARASWFGLVKLGGDYDRQEVLNDLIENKCLEVEVIEGSGFKKEDAWKFLEPILGRINKELEVRMTPPEKVDPAKASEPESGGFFFGAGYSVAIKNVHQLKQGTETISFSARTWVERTTVVGGFVSLKGYPKAVIKDSIVVVPPGPWKSTFFLLPPVGTNVGIESAALTLRLIKGEETLTTRSVIWKVVDGKGVWTDSKGQLTDVLAFPLLGLGVSDVKEAKYQLTVSLRTRDDEVVLERQLPTFDGSMPLPSLSQRLFDVVCINPSALAFTQLDPKSTLEAVHVSLAVKEQSLNTVLLPWNDNGQIGGARPLYFFVPKPEKGQPEPIQLSLAFQVNGKNVSFNGNGDMRKQNPSLKVILSNSHWKTEKEAK